jgi:hypothetical protein
MWNAAEGQTQAVSPSPRYPGPKPGGMWSGVEQQTRTVEPSPQYIGPRPN